MITRRSISSFLGLACGWLAACAQAAPLGFRVDQAQEALVRPGMDVAQVRDLLGRPSFNMKFRNEPGPTYTYLLTARDDAVFDVDFDAQGKVLSTNERMVDPGGDGNHHGRR